MHGKLHSLKSLEDILVEAGVNQLMYDTTTEQEVERAMQTEFGYTKQDIEILREKLIEDLEEVGSDILYGDCKVDKITEVINKRFGHGT